jgi:CheY-like chemotaxis protein
MPKKGPILLIEDDADDQELIKDLVQDIGMENEVICFSRGDDAFLYLMDHLKEQPFIILSDVNVPKVNGIELKKKIDENPMLRKKCIPYVFLSTSRDQNTIDKVYEYTVQGYFIKEASLNTMRENLKIIFAYWTKCKHPNS